ncbi:MAG: hypothetical protein RRY24_07685 [Clostridiales bacterium]
MQQKIFIYFAVTIVALLALSGCTGNKTTYSQITNIDGKIITVATGTYEKESTQTSDTANKGKSTSTFTPEGKSLQYVLTKKVKLLDKNDKAISLKDLDVGDIITVIGKDNTPDEIQVITYSAHNWE